MKRIIFLTIFLLAFNLKATESMRNCMVLPITDGIDNKIGFKVFEEVENYLKESSWCTYKSNSDLINILSQYSKNLPEHLHNKDVLKVISDKTKAGTLIRVDLVVSPGNTDIAVEIIGENGEDKYFKEKTQLKSSDIGMISQTIKNWLDIYEKTIPYSGRVKGVLGDQFTIDIGRKSNIYNGIDIVIERPTIKRQHPLLKEIVDYQTEKIAEAKVFDVNDTQAQAKVIQYESNKKLKIEDWVKVRAQEARKAIDQISYPEKDKTDFGKLGTLGIFLRLGNGSVFLSGNNDRSKKGFMLSGDLESEFWITRNYWFGVDVSKEFGSYKTNEGTFSRDEYSTTNSIFRLKIGYKYLPLGFFYGPQVDAYVGYGTNNIGLNTYTPDGLTDVTFSGLLMGVKGSLPVYDKTRLFMIFDFFLTSSYKENVSIYGSDDSSSHYRIEFGGQYSYEQNIAIQAGISALSNKANFKSGSTKEEQFKNISGKVGAVFTF